MIATAADTLGELAISNVERLYTSGFNVIGSAAQFESFSTIARSSGSLGTTVYLTLSGPGVVDLAGELTGRNAVFTGSNRDDVITTSDGDDVIDGGYGIDQLAGGDGDDSLNGGDGADTLQGGNGEDFLSGDAGNDLLAGGAGGDQLVGGGGVDTASYLTSSTAVRVSLLTFLASGGDAEGDALSSIESLRGSEFNDMLSGDDGINTLDGRGGNDRLLGRAGADVLIGGDGIDEAVYLASSAAVTVSLATGKGAGGDAEGDTLSTIENVSGSRYSDVLTGNSGANMLSGEDGNDRLSGGLGMDVLTGGLRYVRLQYGSRRHQYRDDHRLHGRLGYDPARQVDLFGPAERRSAKFTFRLVVPVRCRPLCQQWTRGDHLQCVDRIPILRLRRLRGDGRAPDRAGFGRPRPQLGRLPPRVEHLIAVPIRADSGHLGFGSDQHTARQRVAGDGSHGDGRDSMRDAGPRYLHGHVSASKPATKLSR